MMRIIRYYIIFVSIFQVCMLVNVKRNIEYTSLVREMIGRDNIPFPCNLNISRSNEIPKSVHEVRPGDIDVVGAIGDSLMAGFGALASDIGDLSEDRGNSFAIGGRGTWSTSTTLPNIMKMFNSHLVGYSEKTCLTRDKESQFNVAEVGAISADMPGMARQLVRKIENDPRINLNRDWKMITHMVGDNDFCKKICFNDLEVVFRNHKNDLLETLRIFRENLPRTIVNVIPPPDIKILTIMKNKPILCYFIQYFFCPCLTKATTKNRRNLLFDAISKWQEIDIEISNYPEFDLDNFTVIPHYLTLDYSYPTTAQGGIDYTYLSADCFHFSQKTHALLGLNLWNSLLQPFGQKNKQGLAPSSMKCPTEDNPFIITRRNSPITNKT